MSVSAWIWNLCCFLTVIVSFLRLRGFSKEGGGYPGWSCPGVAARRRNPGQEDRNQGGRANERVSGETLIFIFGPSLFSRRCLLVFPLMSPCLALFYQSVSPSVFVFLCLSLPLSLSEWVFCWRHTVGSRGSDNSLLAQSDCDCTAASLGVLQGIRSHWFYSPTSSWSIF